MKHDALQQAAEYTQRRRRRERWQKVVTCLAAVVVFCTTYALILPAITLEKQCDIPEHTHTDACYAQVTSAEKRVPVCSAETLEIHRHTADCYDADGNPTCGYADFVVHRHDSSCYDEAGNLWCPLPEIEAHRHTADCYALPEEHTHQVLSCDLPTDSAEDAQPVLVCTKPEIVLHRHTSDCFDADGNLICGQTQVLEHQHSDACFETVAEPVDTTTLTCTDTAPEHVHTALCYGTWELVCGQEEHTHSEACVRSEPEETVFCGKDAHTHGEACRDENGELVCGMEEHTHSLACYADPDADVETAELWEQTFAGVTLTGNWRQDTLAIAETQLGYAESTKNYVVAEDGETVKGYTRYGAWCGEPYGDWNVMFLSFCLHYAGVEGVPPDRDCGSWVTAWADAFEPARSHTAAVGDLVLFDRDGDGTADRAGLVAQITDSGFAAIEGDAEDAVGLLTYGADDPGILGYINLPEGAKEFTLTAQTETGITVTITGESASLPYPAREITATVTEVVDAERRTIRDRILGEEQAEPERSYLLDITLWHGEEEIEPTGSVTVTFSGIDTEGLYPKVYHIDTDTQTATDMEAKTGENGDVTVDTDHFSIYEISLVTASNLMDTIGKDAFQDGGEFILNNDVQTDKNIDQVPITKNTTIDLNGHKLYISKSGQTLTVKSGATLTIKDSRAAEPSKTSADGNKYGRKAEITYDGDSTVPKLTYYVTESSPTDTGTGTTETLYKYELTPAGAIICNVDGGTSSIVNVESGGTLNLEGGLLTIRNGSSYNGDSRIIYNKGTVNINGGYICGGNDSVWGGGVYSDSGSTVNMTGGVIAANYGTSGGGIAVQGGTFIMSGGVISGNGTYNTGVSTGNWNTGLGGGVYAKNTTFRLTGGYITNNSEAGKCDQRGNGCHGGGGVATNGGEFTMTAGYVTGNYSEEAGGGLYVGHANMSGTPFSMSGGTVAGNYAATSEGGGIRISGGTNGTIAGTDKKIYITNNETNSDYDWGGGGVFVQEKGILNIQDTLITSNSAGGFGGGVGACPTGETLITHTDGAAIYSNSASGKHMSEGGHGKNYDDTVANASEVFKTNGFADYFCVKNSDNSNYISLVTGQMVGGGAANWKGSCDNSPITISKTGYAAAKYLFGLTAAPDNAAVNAARGVAGVIISGNIAYTHGGGIMTNGGLILGDPEGKVVTATPELDITGTKVLLKDGVAQDSGLDFQFQLKDSAGTVVGTATADAATGQFTISPNVQYTQPGTYNYTLSEVNDNRSGVTYDTKEYKIQVTIEEKTVTLLGVTFNSYNVASVTLDGSESGGSSGSGSGGDSQTGTFRVRYQNTKNWNDVYMYVWNGDNKPLGAWPGKPMTKESDGSYYFDLSVTGTGTYNYIFNNNSGSQTGNIEGISYEPGKEVVFSADGKVVSNTATGGSSGSGDAVGRGSNSDGSYTLTIPGAAFTNTMTTQLNLQITKTDSVDTKKTLEGATFSLKKQGQETPVEVTTNNNGVATFTGIQRGATYELRETKAPSNYMTAGPWILEVGDGDNATLYPATENPDGTLTKTEETGTSLAVSGDDPKVLSVTVRDISWGYELPATGGAGTHLYTMGGALLIVSAGILLYIHNKRRKEGTAST